QRLEYRAVQVEPTDQRMQRFATRQDAGVSGYVDHARVPAAGQYDQSLARDVDDQCLGVQHQRVRLPLASEPGLLRPEARPRARAPRDLAGHQDRAAEQEAGLALLDDVEAGLGQCPLAGGRQLNRFAAGQGYAALPPEVRVDDDRHVRLADRPDQAVESR